MSDASIAEGRSLPFDAGKVRDGRSTRRSPQKDTSTAEVVGAAPVTNASPTKPGFWRRLRTMGRVDLRGMTIDITPADIEEDLSYGRD